MSMKTKTPTPRAPGACPPPSWEQRGGPAIPVLYRLWPQDPAGHRYRITLTVAEPAADGQRLSLPAWIPGSYLIRDFSRQIESLTAYSGARRVTVNKLDNHTWQAAPCDGPLRVEYEVYAWDLSVRGAHLDETHGFFNGTSVFLRVHGQEQLPCLVDLAPPRASRAGRCTPACRKRAACLARPAATASGCTGRPTTTR